MCTRKKQITVKQSAETLWKIPYLNSNLQKDFIKHGKSKIMAKCGFCYECKKERARNWTYKLWLETKNYDVNENCFLTLTYSDQHIPKNQSLKKKDLQDFIKRLRKNLKLKNIKYFGAGEYGERTRRPHYHIIILGYRPNDIIKMHGVKSKKNKIMYKSETIRKTWGMGRITVQPFAKNEIGYLTLYIEENRILFQKENDKILDEYNKRLTALKIKHKLLERIDLKNQIIYNKIKLIKNLSKDELKAYKKDYNKLKNEINLNKEPEFNIYSKGIGFNNFIKHEYYNTSLIIDNHTYEIPKEYLRKVLENYEEYDTNIQTAITKEIEKRNKWIDENPTTLQIERQKELTQKQENINNKKLNKKGLNFF